MSVEEAKRRLVEGTPTAHDLRRDALSTGVEFVRARPWTCLAVALAAGALAGVSPRARRLALGGAIFAARRFL